MKGWSVYWRALSATWRALRRPPRTSRPTAGRRAAVKLRSRRRALRKLGGRCVCCGAGLDFANVLEFHHVNGNGQLHRRVLRALDTGLVGWIMNCPDPWRGLFAVEVRCVVCHRMLHEAGRCLHRREVKRPREA